MSGFKWVPEVGMKVKVGSSNVSDYVGVLLPEFSHVEYPTAELVILSERRKKVLSWSCRSQILKPVGKKSKAHYAKAKKEWEDAQLVPEVGSYWVLLEDEEHYMKENSVVKIQGKKTHDSTIYVKVLSQTKDKLDCWYISKSNLRPATPEEIKAATRTVWDLEDGDQCFHLLSEGDIVDMTWRGSDLECHRRERGHVFLTRQEAEAEDARRVADNSRVGGGV